MKKELNALINSEDATLKINAFCYLHRWTKNALGENIDCLTVTFDLNYVSSHTYYLAARDWQGIVAEVQEAQTKAFADAAATFNTQLKNGYIG